MKNHHEWMIGHKVFGEVIKGSEPIKFVTDQNEIMELLNKKGWEGITIFNHFHKGFDKYVKFRLKEEKKRKN